MYRPLLPQEAYGHGEEDGFSALARSNGQDVPIRPAARHAYFYDSCSFLLPQPSLPPPPVVQDPGRNMELGMGMKKSVLKSVRRVDGQREVLPISYDDKSLAEWGESIKWRDQKTGDAKQQRQSLGHQTHVPPVQEK